jgi:hypothetical protein
VVQHHDLDGLYKEKGSPPAKAQRSALDVLHMLTSFETFDALLSGERSLEDTTRIVRQLAAAVLKPTSGTSAARG